MRALVTRLGADKRREKVLVTDWPEPKGPTGNEVKTETIYSGITNGTERNDLIGGNYAHKDEDLPRGWGYQNVARVIEVGPGTKELKCGDILCMKADHLEYVVMPENGLLVKLPRQVDPQHAALFGMASVAMRTCRNAGLGVGEHVLIVGAGCIGQFAAQIAAVMGARATICDINEQRLDIARQIGAAEQSLDVSGDGWQKAVPDGAFDVVIDLAGVPGMEDKLIASTRGHGRLLLIGGRFDVRYTFNRAQAREITIKQNSGFDKSDLANLCRLVARGLVDIGPLMRDVVPVSEARRIYDTLRDEPGKLLGTVFDWSDT